MVYTTIMLALHIVIALTSLAVVGIVLARPSQRILNLSYGLIGGTLVSGVALIIFGYSVLYVCTAGVMYSLLSIVIVVAARKRLAAQA